MDAAATGELIREEQLRRLRRLCAMATTGELHRAADLLEFAARVRRGKRAARSQWRGRRSPGNP